MCNFVVEHSTLEGVGVRCPMTFAVYLVSPLHSVSLLRLDLAIDVSCYTVLFET